VPVPPGARAEEQRGAYEVEPIVVTAGRTVTDPGESNRSVDIVTREEIDSLPVHSLPGILEYVPGVDSRRRGPFGVQSDVSIRGAPFEQTVVLIDGIKVSDPQTGHHDLDLPLTLDDVERVEVLKGNASSLYGPNAVGGAVNYVTSRPSGRNVRLRGTGGAFGFREAGASLSLPAGSTASRISAAFSQSDGYRHNTDFDTATASYSGLLGTDAADFRLLLGYSDKEFGANDFYTDRFPDQWEETKTTLLSLSADGGGESFTLSPVLSWRRHRDRFLLDRKEPSFFENRHTTDVYAFELHGLASSRWGRTAIGAEIGSEEIESSGLGDHRRTRGGIYGEHRMGWKGKLSAALEAFAYYYSDWEWEVWPGFNAGWKTGERTRLFASAGRSFRVPTYTELHYTSPANVGNPELEPEKVWSYEIGGAWERSGLSATVAFFRRNGENLIDWVRPEVDSPWTALNISSVTSDGLEAAFTFRPANPGALHILRSFSAAYTFLDSDRNTENFESKYLLDHLRHQVVVGVEHGLFLGARQTWIGRWEERLDDEGYVLLDTRLDLRTGRFVWFLDVKNIFDADYTETGGVPMPGRWVAAGLRIDVTPGGGR